MYKKELMVHVLHMTVVTVEKESMELLNLDHLLIKSYQRDKKQYQGHMVEFFVLDV
jgi:hypothetical protein